MDFHQQMIEVGDGRQQLKDNQGFILVKKRQKTPKTYIPKVFKTLQEAKEFVKKTKVDGFEIGVCTVSTGTLDKPKTANVFYKGDNYYLPINKPEVESKNISVYSLHDLRESQNLSSKDFIKVVLGDTVDYQKYRRIERTPTFSHLMDSKMKSKIIEYFDLPSNAEFVGYFGYSY